jgi:hypothetical protein
MSGARPPLPLFAFTACISTASPYHINRAGENYVMRFVTFIP